MPDNTQNTNPTQPVLNPGSPPTTLPPKPPTAPPTAPPKTGFADSAQPSNFNLPPKLTPVPQMPTSTVPPSVPKLPTPLATPTTPSVKPNVQPTQSPISPQAGTGAKDLAFSTPLPPRSSAINPQPAPLYARPSQNTTETQKPVTSSVSRPSSTPQLKEYKTSIRTMADDISKIKVGQQPSGTDMQKTITPNEPVKTTQPVQALDVSPKSSISSPPPLPARQFPPIPPANLPTKPPLSSGGTPSISVPPRISIPKFQSLPEIIPPKPSLGAPINVREESRRKFNPLFAVIAVLLLVLGGGVYWFLSGESEVSPSPTPEINISPTPETKSLDEIVAVQAESVPLVVSADPTSDFLSALDKVELSSGELRKISPAGESLEIGLIDFLERFSISHPTDLKSTMGSEKTALLYGQTESFDESGKPVVNSRNSKRLIFITEVTDLSSLTSVMERWETSTMVKDVEKLFGLDVNKSKEGVFLGSLYQGFAVRYINFPHPDRSVDYVIVDASNGKKYLVVSNSREATYKAIEILR